MSTAAIRLWGSQIGAVLLEEGSNTAIFQYEPAFSRSGIEVAPLTMPLRAGPYSFPALNPETFHGLPGLLADSLPDRFGNSLIDAWLAGQGRRPESLDAVERLAYTGARGMGALEFEPAAERFGDDEPIQVAALVDLASEVLNEREELVASLSRGERQDTMHEILSVGTSAGGARAKAVIAWNRETNEIRSGQIDAGAGFEYWLLKFDGVEDGRDMKVLTDPKGYGTTEYAYSLMAGQAGVEMTECRLLEENGRRHFMTKRFDRGPDGGKIHMQSLGGLAHFDFNQAGAHSYEQAFLIAGELGLDANAREQLFRRMAFNIVARNQDDHVKNIAFLMDRAGTWTLAPAFDLTYANKPGHRWIGEHQMSLAGKRGGFDLDDFRAAGRVATLPRGRAESILAETTDVVSRWPEFAAEAKVDEWRAEEIGKELRLDLV